MLLGFMVKIDDEKDVTLLVRINTINLTCHSATVRNLESKERLGKINLLSHKVQHFWSCFTHDLPNATI